MAMCKTLKIFLNIISYGLTNDIDFIILSIRIFYFFELTMQYNDKERSKTSISFEI